MIAGYQKFLEGDALGLTNAAIENKSLMEQYGKQGLLIDAHSRGALTFGNTLESLMNQGNAPGTLADTNVRFYGPAYNAAKADELLGNLQNRDAVIDPAKQNDMVLQLQNHAYDPVGRLVGGNPATGGTIPQDSNIAKEVIKVFGGETTVHNCYGAGQGDCEKLWSDFEGGKPVLKPVKTYPVSSGKE